MAVDGVDGWWRAGARVGGALCGWDSPAADPDKYDLQGSYCGPVIKEDYI